MSLPAWSLTATDDPLSNEFSHNGLVVVHGAVPRALLLRLQSRVEEIVATRHRRYVGASERPTETQSEFLLRMARSSGPDRALLDRQLLELHALSPQHELFVQTVLRHLPESFDVIGCDEVLSSVRRCLGLGSLEQGAPINANNLEVRIDAPSGSSTGAVAWQQDWPSHAPLYRSGGSVATWICIFDCPLELGPPVFKRGSQAWGELAPVERIVPPGRVAVAALPDEIGDRASDTEVQLEARAGDLVLFDPRTVYRAGVNQTSDGVRWTLQARYHDASSEKYLPKHLPHGPSASVAQLSTRKTPKP